MANESLAQTNEMLRGQLSAVKEDRQRLLVIIETLRSDNSNLKDALNWALPLAETALETSRQERLRNGHDDIGKDTQSVGLWPREIEQRNFARAILADSSND